MTGDQRLLSAKYPHSHDCKMYSPVSFFPSLALLNHYTVDEILKLRLVIVVPATVVMT